MPQPLSVRLKRRFCTITADFDAEVRISQEKFGAFVGAARERVDRQLQLWRWDGTMDSQRRRI